MLDDLACRAVNFGASIIQMIGRKLSYDHLLVGLWRADFSRSDPPDQTPSAPHPPTPLWSLSARFMEKRARAGKPIFLILNSLARNCCALLGVGSSTDTSRGAFGPPEEAHHPNPTQPMSILDITSVCENLRLHQKQKVFPPWVPLTLHVDPRGRADHWRVADGPFRRRKHLQRDTWGSPLRIPRMDKCMLPSSCFIAGKLTLTPC